MYAYIPAHMEGPLLFEIPLSRIVYGTHMYRSESMHPRDGVLACEHVHKSRAHTKVLD